MTTYPLRHADIIKAIPQGPFTAEQIGANNKAQFLKSLRCKGFIVKLGKVQSSKGHMVNSWRATPQFWALKKRKAAYFQGMP